MFKLRNYLKPHSLLITLGMTFKIFEVAGDLFTPYLISKIIDVGIKTNDTVYIWKVAIFTLIINLLCLLFGILAQKCSAVSSTGVGRLIRRDMFKHINSLSYAELDRFDTTTLINRTVHDVAQTETAVSMTIRLMTRAPLLLIGSIIMSLTINIKLSLIFIAALPIILIPVIIIMKKSIPLIDKSKEKLDDVTDVTRDNLGGIRVVRAFNKQENEKDRFEKENDRLTKINIKTIRITSLLQPIMFLIINLAVVAIMYFGGFEVNVGGVEQGNLIALINYFMQISMSMVIVARLILIYTRTNSSLKRIREVFSVKNTIKNPQKAKLIDMAKPASVEFKRVSFSYGGNKMAVKKLNLKVEPGQVIGIIGGTGSGKTSVVNLIPRLYDTTKGSVLINGKNVKDYDLTELRSYIGIVPQNNVLFEGTIEENMRWRNENATEEEIVNALKIAQAYDFVMEKPDGLKSKVLRNGSNFSGGQKQRLCIARALIGNPKILILDDSSSALDFKTDYNLRKAIRKNLKDTTLFLVSQRTNTLKDSDNIIVMDNGDVVDIGSHKDLLSRCQVYKEIYSSQNKRGGKSK